MARFALARWLGPVPNMTPGGMVFPLMGIVLHIESGTEPGTNTWFHDKKAQVSAHFGNPKHGTLDQWVDTKDKAWAEASGNPRWLSVEHEGVSGDKLTPSQIENDAQLLAWVHTLYGVPLQITNRVSRRGLGWHGMGGELWGGHTQCPGSPILKQRPLIIKRAFELVNSE